MSKHFRNKIQIRNILFFGRKQTRSTQFLISTAKAMRDEEAKRGERGRWRGHPV
jgi:hypothetical protein